MSRLDSPRVSATNAGALAAVMRPARACTAPEQDGPVCQTEPEGSAEARRIPLGPSRGNSINRESGDS